MMMMIMVIITYDGAMSMSLWWVVNRSEVGPENHYRAYIFAIVEHKSIAKSRHVGRVQNKPCLNRRVVFTQWMFRRALGDSGFVFNELHVSDRRSSFGRCYVCVCVCVWWVGALGN